MPKQLLFCICHDEVLMLAPHCTSDPALAVLFLQGQRRIDIDRRIVHEHLRRKDRSHISLIHTLCSGCQIDSCQLSTTNLSSRCCASKTKVPSVLKYSPQVSCRVQSKNSDSVSVVDHSQHSLQLRASEIRPGYCKEAQHVPYALPGGYVFSNEVVSCYSVHYVLDAWFMSLSIGPRHAVWLL